MSVVMTTVAVLSPEPAPVLATVGEPADQHRLSVLARPCWPCLICWPSSWWPRPSSSWWRWAGLGPSAGGRLPLFAAVILSGYLGWQTRVLAYLFLLTDVYPPFTLADAAYPVRVTTRQGRLNRFAVLLRPLLALPAAAVAATATAGLAIVLLLAWLTTVVSGRLPSSLHQARRRLRPVPDRLSGYLTMVTSEYPWGLLGDPENGDGGVLPGRPGGHRRGRARPRPGNRPRRRPPGIPTGGWSSCWWPRTPSSSSSSAWPRWWP